MVVKAWLEGSPHDLAVLVDLLGDGDVRIVRDEDDEQNRYYLTAPDIDNPPEPRKYDAPATNLTRLINGLARTRDPAFRAVAFSGIVNDDEGVIVFAAAAAELRLVTFAAVGVVTGPDGERIPDPPSPWPGRLAIAATDNNVAEVLEIMGQPEPLGWSELYKIHEIIRDTIKPDKIIDLEWADKSTDSAFTASANRADVSGATARHARNSGGPPTRTMTLAQGRTFVSDLAARWLDSLVPKSDAGC